MTSSHSLARLSPRWVEGYTHWVTDLSGRVVVVTGASSGFGAATAIRLSEVGAKVALISRREDRLQAVARNCSGPTVTMSLDVRDHCAIIKAVKALEDGFGPVYGLVNSAGLSLGFGPATRNDIGDWRAMVDTNIVGTMNWLHALLPEMENRDEGHIVNVGSVAARYPYMGGNVYAATKAFVHQLSANLRADLQSSRLRITCIAPGMAKTEFALVRFRGDEQKVTDFYGDIVTLCAEDVAEAIVWALTRPPHVNVNMIEIMPVDQPFGLGVS